MPNNVWPPNISQAFTSDAFTEEAQAVTIRTQMDTGPGKMRRRFVNPQKTYNCEIILRDSNEYQTLTDFYYLTCQGGTDTIILAHPITGVMTTFRFATTIAFTAIGIAWKAAFQLESLP